MKTFMFFEELPEALQVIASRVLPEPQKYVMQHWEDSFEPIGRTKDLSLYGTETGIVLFNTEKGVWDTDLLQEVRPLERK